jgi:alpha-tubulin suppressor-like RCC1 family protein
MACPEITTIPSSECIGNSLITINSNFDTLKNAICDISINETGIAIEDEGNSIGINIGTVNFIGAGVNTIVQGNRAQVNIPGVELVKVSGLEEQGTNSGGGRDNFFILNDGSLRVVGLNQRGELGIGLADKKVFTPRVAGFAPPLELGEGISKIYSQHNCTYIVTSFGRVYSAGRNDQGQLGIGNLTTPTPIFTFVNAINESALSLDDVTNPVPGYAAAKLPGNKIIQLSTGSGADSRLLTIFALSEDGRVFVWGANSLGQTGNPTVPSFNNVPTPSQSTTFTGVGRLITSAGNNNKTTTFVVDTQDKLYVVGRNQDGQAGTSNNNVDIKAFQQVIGLPSNYRVNNVRVGGTADQITTFVTLKDGTLYAAGRNRNGACSGTGDATPLNFISFSRVGGFTDSDFVEDVAVHIDANAITCWALVRDGISGYKVKCWGNNTYGQLGLGTTATTVAVSENTAWPWLSIPGVKVSQIVVAGNGTQKTTLVLDTANRLWAAGYGASGLIGNGRTTPNNSTFQRVAFNPGLGYPIQIRSTNNDVTNKANFLALLNTGKVLGWGWDEVASGQLGVDASPAVTTVPSLVQIVI